MTATSAAFLPKIWVIPSRKLGSRCRFGAQLPSAPYVPCSGSRMAKFLFCRIFATRTLVTRGSGERGALGRRRASRAAQ